MIVPSFYLQFIREPEFPIELTFKQNHTPAVLVQRSFCTNEVAIPVL